MAPTRSLFGVFRFVADPAAACSAWTVTQHRELLRVLFAGITVKYVGYRNGPRVDPGRLVLTWAR